jgi:hypothetical protein
MSGTGQRTDAQTAMEGHMDVKVVRTLIAAVALTALLPTVAQAGVLVESAPSCDAQPLSRPFLRWLDPAQYTPLAGGSFEAGAPAWALHNGPKVIEGNETWKVRDAADHRSLRLPAGSRALSPTICVGLGHPTMRFFARRVGGTVLSTLRVEVRTETTLGATLTLPIGVVVGGDRWAASLPMTVIANLLPLLPGETTPVQFRFVPQGAAAWDIDDVYVDPWHSR